MGRESVDGECGYGGREVRRVGMEVGSGERWGRRGSEESGDGGGEGGVMGK